MSEQPDSKSTINKNVRKQSQYHTDEGFDYEKFFFSIYSFTDPIFEEEFLRFTTIFIFEDEAGRPYANYRISDKLQKIPDFDDEVELLSRRYRIYLDDEKNAGFSIYKIYHSFEKYKELDPKNDFAKGGKFEIVNLNAYFQDETALPEDEDFSKLPATLENFISAESVYIGVLLKEYSNQAEYMPLPIISRGNLMGIIYFIFDEENFKGGSREGDSIENSSFMFSYRNLLLAATREYERVNLESKFRGFALKPQDPLEDYWEVFNDLKYTKKKKHRKKIGYRFLYDLGAWNPVITENLFLLDLGYDDYYKNQAYVLEKESEYLQEAKKERVRNAITAIVVDSFAHNIGAHCLVALKWWFENRYRIAAQAGKVDLDKELVSILPLQSLVKDILTNLDATYGFHSFMDYEDGQEQNENGGQREISLLDIIRFMKPKSQLGEDSNGKSNIGKHLLAYHEKGKKGEIARFPIPVAQSLFHFFEYLRDKSAFWSGVARDTVFSGRFKTWPELLREFLNNTLFLGTIAHSEGINKLQVFVEVHHKGGKIKVGGEYARINLEVMEREKAEYLGLEAPEIKKDKHNYSEYAFLRKGDEFDTIQPELEKLGKVYLSNGVIGQHALYTLLENTLRNIKHYRDDLDDIKKKGVRLYITIEPMPFWKRPDVTSRSTENRAEKVRVLTEEKKLFRVGTWLHHEQELVNNTPAFINEEKDLLFKDKNGNEIKQGAVIAGHTQQLRRRVVDEKGNTILGGSAQDKVCAAMLMNNTFRSIDDISVDTKRHYFPYVYAASEVYMKPKVRKKGHLSNDRFLNKVYNPLISHNHPLERRKRYKNATLSYIKEFSQEGKKKGLIKKYFHLWKGERCKLANDEFDRMNENLSRFQVVISDNFQELKYFRRKGDIEQKRGTAEYELRRKGLLRIVEANDAIRAAENGSDAQYNLAMAAWLGDWLNPENGMTGIQICMPAPDREGKIGVVHIWKEENVWNLEYHSQLELRRRGNEKLRIEARKFPAFNLKHKEQSDAKDVCQLRSHGSFITFLYEGSTFKNLPRHTFDETRQDRAARLLETLLTEITIFDDRVFERLPLKPEVKGEKVFDPFRDALRIQAFPEKHEAFNHGRKKENKDKKEIDFLQKKSHFLIVHLSFIESIFRSGTQKPYKENEVDEFFKNEIADRYKENNNGKELPSNVILVITSGRGRGDWFQATEHPQITFRPIEAILDAIEDGLSLKDDFQVKYNLCNVLFGS